jgi:hypothetical protein
MNEPGQPLDTGTEIDRARRRLGLSAYDVWIGYFAVGGNGAPIDVERWLAGDGDVPLREHNLLAQALNDRFTHGGLNHPIAYRELP